MISPVVLTRIAQKFPTNFKEVIPDLEGRTSELRSGLDQLLAQYEGMRNLVAQRPFFFMVGAGISSPPVKLASEIVKDCGGTGEHSSRMSEYETALREKYPLELERQGYIQGLIDGQYVSTGNFRLAHLLLANLSNERFANLVVTTNFDDFLARALTIFGEVPRVYHHPHVAKEARFENRENIQILHLHGSYHFYDIANLNAEVSERAKEMSSVVVRILQRVTPIVVGYSGWEHDAFMQGLRHQLLAPSDANVADNFQPSIFWFCYRQESLAELPTWLLQSKRLRFIIPASVEEAPLEEIKRFYRGAPSYTEKSSIAYTLPSTQVFDALISRFKIPEPLLVSEPAIALANLLDKMLPPEDVGNRYRKQYFLRRIVRQLRRYAASEVDEFEIKIRDVLTNIRRSNYAEALRLGRLLWQGLINGSEGHSEPHSASGGLKSLLRKDRVSVPALYCACDLMDAFWSITFGITVPDKQNQLELEAYTLCIDVATTLIRLSHPETPRDVKALTEQMVNALLHRAVWLTETTDATDKNAVKDALNAKKEFLCLERKYGIHGRALRFPVQAAWALLNRGVLSVQEAPGNALRYFSKIQTWYRPELFLDLADHDRLIEPWIKAACNSAVVFVEREEFSKALEKAREIQNAAAQYAAQSELGVVREKAKRIEEYCSERIAAAFGASITKPRGKRKSKPRVGEKIKPRSRSVSQTAEGELTRRGRKPAFVKIIDE